ncbi:MULTISPECIES: class I SAM-dependent methyltransferase [unclassified Corallococcus]|uniref:class I SAM-dependent methyltransferase n=1 Tax=unclassified Corallococcus TaxID=2685029 RepID=UPI001A8F6D26|nr:MULTISPECIES: class I SAM-dependent methyltransferase [unclassified Corallococcus]MBN9687775.1 methyltransferase domain-containing protein [Corallococcus sp. NCSPR001]WAS88412.1 class I SAM-dependent methyltransferase [Corallococcus sp. NCRR]
MPSDLLEISDLIVDYDVATLQPRPVSRDAVVARLMTNGQRAAARFVQRLPASNDTLDFEACDLALLRSHIELQRLSEEFLQADRLRCVLLPLLQALRESGVKPPLRIVDVGCGLGYAVRSLAAHGRLGRDVEIIGCDMNVTLIENARRLAEEESLSCELRVANAFQLEQPGHIFISTGVLHHFRGDDLHAFFAGQRQGHAFVHYDIQNSVLSPWGSWMFHQARMREPLARHDGVVSARRAHPTRTLLSAARSATEFTCASLDGARNLLGVMLRPMTATLGTRAALWEPLQRHLGPLRPRLGHTS